MPHLYWACGLIDGGSSLSLVVDFRPRAAAGYETVLPDGTYPEPDSREAFALKGVRTATPRNPCYFDEIEGGRVLLKAVFVALTVAQPLFRTLFSFPMVSESVFPAFKNAGYGARYRVCRDVLHRRRDESDRVAQGDGGCGSIPDAVGAQSNRRAVPPRRDDPNERCQPLQPTAF